jgi:hypothetical protein
MVTFEVGSSNNGNGIETKANGKGSSGYTVMLGSNGKSIEAKRSESFVNYVFCDIDAKRTRSIVRESILKRSEHVYIKNLKI